MATERKILSAFGTIAQKLYCVGCKTSLDPEEFWGSNGTISALRTVKIKSTNLYYVKNVLVHYIIKY